jgi:hypothetical protein
MCVPQTQLVTNTSQTRQSPETSSPVRPARQSSLRRMSAALGLMIPAAAVAFALPLRADARAAKSDVARTAAFTSVTGAASSVALSSSNANMNELLDTLRGRSRKLRARFVAPKRAASIPVLRELFGDTAVSKPGVYAAADSASSSSFSFITMRPFSDKVAGRIGSYRIGFFPQEKHGARSAAYVNPEGFLEVTADNQSTLVSEHFRLSDFLTHDQVRVWPKYLVLREPLIDKLELVIGELKNMGVKVNGMKVMSGFRTPQYNEPGVGAGGRASDSRHQYGDAADVYIVNGSRDWMSDLNADGRVDTRDAKVLAMAAERVEAKHPDLIGGIGIYKATSAHGPFVHIDVRGNRARWGE